jgi:hypothetical protein
MNRAAFILFVGLWIATAGCGWISDYIDQGVREYYGKHPATVEPSEKSAAGHDDQ